MARLIAVFVSAPSPGQVYRFLERNLARAGASPTGAPVLSFSPLLSDGTGPRSYRALTLAEFSPEAAAWLEAAAPRLANGFASEEAPAWLLILHDDGTWEHRRWTVRDAPPTVFESSNDDAKPGPLSTFLSRLGKSNAKSSVSDAVTLWAREQGLPISRVPGVVRRGGPRIIDYATVAQLDQKGLLLEDGPRLYRLTL